MRFCGKGNRIPGIAGVGPRDGPVSRGASGWLTPPSVAVPLLPPPPVPGGSSSDGCLQPVAPATNAATTAIRESQPIIRLRIRSEPARVALRRGRKRENTKTDQEVQSVVVGHPGSGADGDNRRRGVRFLTVPR